MRSQIKSHFFYFKAYLLVLSTVCLLCSSVHGAPTQPTPAQTEAAPSLDATPGVESDFEEEAEEEMDTTEGAEAEEGAAGEESNDAGEPLFETADLPEDTWWMSGEGRKLRSYFELGMFVSSGGNRYLIPEDICLLCGIVDLGDGLQLRGGYFFHDMFAAELALEHVKNQRSNSLYTKSALTFGVRWALPTYLSPFVSQAISVTSLAGGWSDFKGCGEDLFCELDGAKITTVWRGGSSLRGLTSRTTVGVQLSYQMLTLSAGLSEEWWLVSNQDQSVERYEIQSNAAEENTPILKQAQRFDHAFTNFELNLGYRF